MTTENNNQEQQAIELALELIASTETGRNLVVAFKQNNATISFDKTLPYNITGLTDFDMQDKRPPEIRLNKKLIPSEEQEATMAMEPAGSDEKLGKLICILTHELAHLAVGKENDFSVVFRKHNPSDVLTLMRIDEANAFAHTSQVAWELKETQGLDIAWNDLTGQARYKFGTEEFKSPQDFATIEFAKTLENDKSAGNSGKAMKAAFASRFERIENNDVYNDMYLSTYEEVLADKNFFSQLKQQNKENRKNWLKEKKADLFITTKPVDKKLISLFGDYLKDEKGSFSYLFSAENKKKGMDKTDIIRLNRIETWVKSIQDDIKTQNNINYQPFERTR